MAIVGIIGDTHCPGMHDRYVEFCDWVFRSWGVDTVVHIGDGCDFRGINFHMKQTGIDDIDTEVALAVGQLSQIYKAFPDAYYMTGNHSALPERKAAEVGLSRKFLVKLDDLLEMPKTWKVRPRFDDLDIDGVLYRHGDKGSRGQYCAAYNNAVTQFTSCVQGHHHTQASVLYLVNYKFRAFGLQVGCGVDPRTNYLDYAAQYAKRGVLGCGVVVHGKEAHFVPMELEDWPRHDPNRKDLIHALG